MRWASVIVGLFSNGRNAKCVVLYPSGAARRTRRNFCLARIKCNLELFCHGGVWSFSDGRNTKRVVGFDLRGGGGGVVRGCVGCESLCTGESINATNGDPKRNLYIRPFRIRNIDMMSKYFILFILRWIVLRVAGFLFKQSLGLMERRKIDIFQNRAAGKQERVCAGK